MLEGHPAFTDADRPDLTGVVSSAVGGEVRLLEDVRGALGTPVLEALRGRLRASGAVVICMPKAGGRYVDVQTR